MSVVFITLNPNRFLLVGISLLIDNVIHKTNIRAT